MATSKAATVPAYLKALPAERRAMMSAVRKVIVQNLPKGYRESIGWGGGVITYDIPLERFPDTYNGHPLTYVALASKKNYCTLHLMMPYGDSKRQNWLAEEFKKRGKKLDMGKACVRFKKLEDLPLDVIGEAIASVAPADYIKSYEASRRK
jgi:uncharacterized protein DUF1801